MKFVVTDEAKADIKRIADYISVDNPRAADRLLIQFRKRFIEIRENPHASTYATGFEDRHIRRKIHGNYLILYRLADDRIQVIHVLHGAMDLNAILMEPQ